MVANCHEYTDEALRWSPTEPGWTERHSAFRMQANLVAYEVLGSVVYRDRVQTGVDNYIWHQNGADGQIPTNRIDGAMWHEMLQHEGAEADKMMASPWMSVLSVDVMVRIYAVTESAGIGHFVRRMGTFLAASAKRVESTLYDVEGDGTIREVDYITFIDGTTFDGDGTTPEHALEVAAAIAWSDYFGRLLGPANPQLAAVAIDLYRTFDIGVNYWIRPNAPTGGLPAYSVFPPRKWAWEHRVSGSLSWALGQPPSAQLGPPTGLNAVSISGATVTIAWTAPSGGTTPTGYVLEGGVTPGEVLASIPTGSANPTFAFDAPTGRFYVRLHSTAGAQKSAASNEIRISVNMPAPPPAPANLRGVAHGSTLALSWRNTGAADQVRLNVTGSIATALMMPAAESFTYVGVPPGTYNFAVQGFNGGEAGEGSNPVTLSFPGTCPGPPNPPQDLLITTAGRTITASWGQPFTGPAVTQYTILVSGSFNGAIPLPVRTISGTVGPGSYTISVTASNPCGTSTATPAQTVAVS